MNPGAGADLPSPQLGVSRGVCGYVRAELPDELEIAALRAEILRYCRKHGFRLEAVFIDRRVDGDQVKRPGIAGVLDVLSLPDAMGVVVPSIDHLAAGGEALATLRRLIRRAGGLLLCIEGGQDDLMADGA